MHAVEEDEAEAAVPRAQGAVENCASEAAYHVKEARRLFEELLRAQASQAVMQMTQTRDGRARNHVNILRHHLEEALANISREGSFLRRLRIDRQVFQELFTENLKFHHDYLLESRRVASAREALHIALKEQAKLHQDLQAERIKTRKLEKDMRKMKRQMEELEQQVRRPTQAPRPAHTGNLAPTPGSVLEQLMQMQPQSSTAASSTQANTAAPGSARKRPRTEKGTALVGKVIQKQFDDAGSFWGEIIDYDETTQYYRVAYEDGDREDFYLRELEQLIVEDATWRLSDRAREEALAEMERELIQASDNMRENRQYLDSRSNGRSHHR